MRDTRALLASMGAATSLILAGTIVLTLASGLVAFKGWPGVREQDRGDRQALIVQVRAETRATAETATMRVPGPSAFAARPTRAAGGGGGTTIARHLSDTPGLGSAVTSGSPSASAGTSGAGTGTGTVVTTAPRPPVTPAGGEVVRRLGEQLGTTVGTAGDTASESVTPVAPAAGAAVGQATGAVGQILQDVTGSVGQVVDGLGSWPAG